MSGRLFAALGVALVLCGGCTALLPGDEPAPGSDAGGRVDAGRFDAGRFDAGPPEPDAGPFDAGERDGGPIGPDAGPDGGPALDDGGIDGGMQDAGPSPPCATSASPALLSIAAGGDTSCVRRMDGVYCWGGNQNAQIDDSGDLTLAPTRVFGPGATDVCVGDGFVCGLFNLAVTSTIDCRGAGPAVAPFIGGARSLTGSFSQIICGGAHACVLSEDGALHCWGANGTGNAQSGQTGDFPGVADRTGVADAVAGAAHTCVLDVTGAVSCFGDSAGYGGGAPGTSTNPRAIASSSIHALDAEGELTCLAHVNMGVSCYGVAPPMDRTAADPTHLSVGGLGFACAVESTPSNEVTCWGANGGGQLGRPQPKGEAEHSLCGPVDDMHSGRAHTCAIAGPNVQCWGANGSGQAGFVGARTSPPRVVALP